MKDFLNVIIFVDVKKKGIAKNLTELKENNENTQRPKLWQHIIEGFIP